MFLLVFHGFYFGSAGEWVLRLLRDFRVHPAGVLASGAETIHAGDGIAEGVEEPKGDVWAEYPRVREVGVDVSCQGAVVQLAGGGGRAKCLPGGKLQLGLPVAGPRLGSAAVSLHAGAAPAAAAGAGA